MSKELDAARELVRMLEEKEKAQEVGCADSFDGVELSSLTPGETFKIGEYDFIVLEQKQGQTAVISKGFMAKNNLKLLKNAYLYAIIT